MSITIRKAVKADIDSIARLYDDLNDHLAAHVNYPGWHKGSYPLRQDAEDGLADGTLYVAEMNGNIAGTVMYLHTQCEPYKTVDWQLPFDVPVIALHILAVHPAYQGQGVGRSLMDYAETLACETGALAIRLDTHENNMPACRLYEACGYSMRGLVDLGLYEKYGLKWYKTFEKIIK